MIKIEININKFLFGVHLSIFPVKQITSKLKTWNWNIERPCKLGSRVTREEQFRKIFEYIPLTKNTNVPL